ncbi:MAG: triose-phosphate isomerase [Candidatus Improbicoccus devescovinae]|nr:MAG: triose-phosphate isomerase [Candidatus Improbicoccus devescovinae]
MKIIAGNWKINNIPKETTNFFGKLNKLFSNTHAKTSNIIIAPPYVSLQAALDSNNNDIKIFAQNCHWETDNSHTGEISVTMLKEMGISGVILGHSEQRILGECDNIINKKIKTVLEFGLNTIFCVGENLQEYQKNNSKNVIKSQILNGLKNINIINTSQNNNIIIAYEPVWAIGSAQTASLEFIREITNFIKQIVNNKFVKILYGGSVNSENIQKILKISDNINGVLIGRASVTPEEFFLCIKNT